MKKHSRAKSFELARDVLKNRMLPLNGHSRSLRVRCRQNAAPAKAGAAALMFDNFRPNTPDSAFDYDTAAEPHPPLRLRLGAPSPKGKALGAI